MSEKLEWLPLPVDFGGWIAQTRDLLTPEIVANIDRALAAAPAQDRKREPINGLLNIPKRTDLL